MSHVAAQGRHANPYGFKLILPCSREVARVAPGEAGGKYDSPQSVACDGAQHRSKDTHADFLPCTAPAGDFFRLGEDTNEKIPSSSKSRLRYRTDVLSFLLSGSDACAKLHPRDDRFGQFKPREGVSYRQQHERHFQE